MQEMPLHNSRRLSICDIKLSIIVYAGFIFLLAHRRRRQPWAVEKIEKRILPLAWKVQFIMNFLKTNIFDRKKFCTYIGESTALLKKTRFIIITNLTLKITWRQHPVDCENILSHIYRVNNQGTHVLLNAIYFILVYIPKCICGGPGNYEEERRLIVGRTQAIFLNKPHDNYINV